MYGVYFSGASGHVGPLREWIASGCFCFLLVCRPRVGRAPACSGPAREHAPAHAAAAFAARRDAAAGASHVPLLLADRRLGVRRALLRVGPNDKKKAPLRSLKRCLPAQYLPLNFSRGY